MRKMKAVILAAGLGVRMGDLAKGIPKCLIKVAGREILYRTMKLLEEQGIEEFIVITNPHYMGKLKNFLEKNRFNYRILVNPYPEKGNGYSLYLSKNYVSGKFVLVMSDHIYEEKFIKVALKGEGIIVDKVGKFTNKEEATKVKIKEGKIADIGKNIKEYDAFDTGFFLLRPNIFDIAEKLLEKNDVLELTEVAKEARLKVTEVNGSFWMDIDTPEDVKKAKRLLIKNAVKDTGDGLVSRYVNRKISTRISELLVDYVEPFHMTFFSFLVGISAGLLGLFNPPLAGVVYQVSSILDGVDGEIARSAMKKSRFGGYLDSILDRYVDFFVLWALAIYMKPSPQMWLVILLAIFGSFMVSYSTERYKGEYFVSAYTSVPVLKYLIGKRDERVFMTMFLCLIGRLDILFFLLALITHLRVLVTVWLIWRKKETNS